MIYDTFNFSNELEVLEIRLNELNDFVDVFVLTEGTKTFQDNPKPLIYEENKQRFAAFHHKIRHVIIDGNPDASEDWCGPERYQFNEGGKRGMPDIGIDDHVIFGCVDEIPNKAVVRSAMRYVDYPQMLMMMNFVGYLNCQIAGRWNGCRLLTGRMWRESKDQFGDFRQHYLANHIQDAGWHFCNMGGAERLREKFTWSIHKELNTPEWLATCEETIRSNYELRGTHTPLSRAPLEMLPAYIAANKEKFAHMLIPETI